MKTEIQLIEEEIELAKGRLQLAKEKEREAKAKRKPELARGVLSKFTEAEIYKFQTSVTDEFGSTIEADVGDGYDVIVTLSRRNKNPSYSTVKTISIEELKAYIKSIEKFKQVHLQYKHGGNVLFSYPAFELSESRVCLK